MRRFGSLCAVVLALVLVWAAAAKLARPGRTAAGFRALGLPAATVLAWAVPGAELVAAALLLAVPRLGGVAAIAVLAVFTGVVVAAVRRGVSAGCTCFGVVTSKPVSPRDVVRNVALMALAAVAVVAG